MLQFLLCDDNLSILSRLEKMFQTLFNTHHLDAQIVLATTNASEALEYVMHHDIQVVVLDIDLKSNLSGLDLAEHIRRINKEIYLIFTTGHLEYSLVAYKYKTFDFLPKPITVERLEETLMRLLEDINSKLHKFITLDNGNMMIREKNINYIKKDGMKLIINTDSKDYEVYSPIYKIEHQLSDTFVRCHKSYIVNLDKITDINVQDNSIVINSDCICSIGPKYKNNFMEVISKYGNFSINYNCVNDAK